MSLPILGSILGDGGEVAAACRALEAAIVRQGSADCPDATPSPCPACPCPRPLAQSLSTAATSQSTRTCYRAAGRLCTPVAGRCPGYGSCTTVTVTCAVAVASAGAVAPRARDHEAQGFAGLRGPLHDWSGAVLEELGGVLGASQDSVGGLGTARTKGRRREEPPSLSHQLLRSHSRGQL